MGSEEGGETATEKLCRSKMLPERRLIKQQTTFQPWQRLKGVEDEAMLQFPDFGLGLMRKS